ncbi:MAG: hypothetical protein K9J27_06400 [Bacteroidales bacterium]|nr:hypothetical protein [Bacteroidales bacterium]MCF8333305.1 hypothetical protein [Bacteroidales bacterium]
MSTEEIKKRLHESIENIDDHELLKTVNEILSRKYDSSEIPKLTLQQEKRIEESEQQICNGEYYTDKQADRIIDKWLEK